MSGYTKIASRCLSASAAIAVATALSVASPAFAADEPATTAPASQHATTQEPLTGTHIRKAADPHDLGKIEVYGGADLRAGDAQWTDDDTSAPALPMTRNQDAVSH